jgi:ribosome-associated toxin RatA of RatAB toxin-antitoxin module
MKQITRSALLPYSAQSVFDLVNQVDSYPEFLPWCCGSEVLESTDQTMVARIDIKKAGIQQSFTTRNRLNPPHQIQLSLVDGPFDTLEGEWHFDSIGDQACRISLDMRFSIRNKLLNMAVGPVFEQIAATLVQSFCDRAKALYG